MQITSSIFTMADFKSELRKDQYKVLLLSRCQQKKHKKVSRTKTGKRTSKTTQNQTKNKSINRNTWGCKSKLLRNLSLGNWLWPIMQRHLICFFFFSNFFQVFLSNSFGILVNKRARLYGSGRTTAAST